LIVIVLLSLAQFLVCRMLLLVVRNNKYIRRESSWILILSFQEEVEGLEFGVEKRETGEKS